MGPLHEILRYFWILCQISHIVHALLKKKVKRPLSLWETLTFLTRLGKMLENGSQQS